MPAAHNTSSLRDLVRGRRLELRWSQRHAAEQAGISSSTWQAIERHQPTGAFQDLTLSRIAHALDLPVDLVLAAARRSAAPSSDPQPAEALPPAVAQTIEHITAHARRVAHHAPEDLPLVHGVITQIAEHLTSRAVPD